MKTKKKKLPIGISNFKEIIEYDYFILIKLDLLKKF